MDFMNYDGMMQPSYGQQELMQQSMYNQNPYMMQQDMMMQRKYSKGEVKDGLMQYLMCQGLPVNNCVMIEEEPDVLRHACEPVGISGLRTNFFEVRQPFGTVQVKYWHCPACGKLYISKLSMDFSL